MLGIVISIVALAAVVWWALRQDPPRLPHGAAQIGALVGAIALYGFNTLVRSERWHRLLLDDGAQPARTDSYALTTIGYAVNNVLPARAGDAVRVVLMAPRAAASRRTVLGTIVAERLLDVGVILVLFLVVGYAVLGNVGAGSVEWIALATAAVIAGAAVAIVLVRRNERIHAFVAPMLSSTARLLSRHGALLVAMTFAIWTIEATVVDRGRRLRRLRDELPRGPLPRGARERVRADPVRPRLRRHPGCGHRHRHQGDRGHGRDRRVLPRDAALRPARPDHRGRLPAARHPLRRPGAGPGGARVRRRPSREVVAYAVLVAAALALRLYDLGSRPFHHDESQDAYFSWILFTNGDYQYQPILHGPLRFYLTASMFSLFGDSDFTARLAPALMGTSMVAMPYFLRRQLGRVAAYSAAVLFAIGPSYLYFSRFAREDIYFAAISFALLVVVFRFLDTPRGWHPALIGALIALGFATKETMYIAGFVAFTFFAILLVREGRGGPTRAALRSVGWEAWVWALAAFAAVFTLMFTVFLTNPSGLWDGLYESIAYWIRQHGVGRGGEKPYFYVAVLFGDEWPVLLLGAVGAFVAFRQPTVLRAFLVWAFALSLAIYSWAGEKFAWLVLHPLLPLVLLAGLGVQWLWEARRTRLGRAGLAVAAVGVLYVPVASWWVNVDHRAEPARAAGLDAVLGGGQARGRPGDRDGAQAAPSCR